MQLRKAESKDTDIVSRILDSSRREYLPYAISPHTLEEQRLWVREKLIPSDRVVIARQNGVDVGVLATSISDGYGWIDQLFISPGNVGNGIGTMLLHHAFSVLPRPIRLWTFQMNDGAIKFYKRHGFNAVEYTDGRNNEEHCPDVLFEYDNSL